MAKKTAGETMFRVHLDIPLLQKEGGSLGRLLASPDGRSLKRAFAILEQAMDRQGVKGPEATRARRFVAAAFAPITLPPGGPVTRGRWPRINYVVLTDYAESMAG